MSAAGSLVGSQVGSLRGTRAGVLAVPSGLGWTPSYTISQGPGRGYRASLDPATRKITPSITRYVSTTGSDVAAGTSLALAWRSIDKAITTVGGVAATIYVSAGDYRGIYGWNAGAAPYLYAATNMIAVGGRVRISISAAALTWTPDATYPSVYAATTTAPYGVVDEAQLDAFGVGTWLTSRASVVLVNSNPGSYYASGGVLYVRTSDSRSPDNSIHHPVAATINAQLLNGISGYFEGIDFIGGSSTFIIPASGANLLTFVDCGFLYGELNGFRSAATIDTEGAFFRCRAAGTYGSGGAGGDGFSYAASGRFLEQDCVSLSNGRDAASISNGSTAHGAKVIRLGGYYANNEGPNVADVVSSKSVNLGLRCAASRGAGTQGNNFASDGATGEMWIAGSLSESPGGGGDARTYNAGAKIYLRDTGVVSTTGTGTVGTW